MAMIDTTVLLVLCYVFGILTAAILYVLVVSPADRARKRRDYMSGYMDGLGKAREVDDIDY